MRPRWCLRCATLRGINMMNQSSPRKCGASWPPWVRRAISSSSSSSFSSSGSASLISGAASTSSSSTGRRPADDTTLRGWPAPDGLADGHGRLAGDLVVVERLVGHDVALVDPHLHADAAAGGAGLADAVVDVGAQRVQRHPTFAVPLGAAHLGAAEATRALHPDAEGAGLLGVLHGALHGPAEGDAVDQLVGDALGDERGVELGALDLDDVELHLRVAGDLGEQRAQLVGLGATATDHDARDGRCGCRRGPCRGCARSRCG